MPTDMTMGDFVRHLAARMQKAGIAMPFKNERPWHLLFYHLTTADLPDKPAFLGALMFDWDGPYPRCRALSEFIQALHWTGNVSVGNPSYETLSVQPEVLALWQEEGEALPEGMRGFLDQTAERARQEFAGAGL
jgi:hypothetical protein